MNVTIVKAQQADAKAILHVQKLAYRSEAEIYNDYSILPLHETVSDVEKAFSEYMILKAVASNGEIAGSVRAKKENDQISIAKLMVHPDWQNYGIGRKLMEAIEQEVPGKRYSLFTGSKSVKNLALYQKLGYRIYKEGQLPGEATVFAFMEKTRSSHV
ncbi:GNAT family N-acetyltransferase [Shouchella patagoniensis]|uniref:GNAT family N-acetyltransferase n=1 Tax=Shouchella patagoniensis TaxID=228576 RepID=UPI000994FD10|nr:GNAT family N-acetyltransferase [Shouchella patagoniensis]